MAYVSAYPPASCGGGWTRVHGPMEQRLWTMSPSESSVSAQGSIEPSSCPVRAFPPSDRSPRSECCLSREVLEQHPVARLLVLTPPLLGQVASAPSGRAAGAKFQCTKPPEGNPAVAHAARAPAPPFYPGGGGGV